MASAERIIGYTVEDIYNLPEGQRAELIEGELYMMAPPNRRHQEIVARFTQIIANYIDKNGGKCKVYPAPFAVFLTGNNKNYVEPDISVICDKDKLSDRGCEGAPDWVIEIVSPASRRMDYQTKLLKYANSGVREYWIVDMEKDRVTVHNFEKSEMNEYSFADTVKAGIYEDLEIDFKEM